MQENVNSASPIEILKDRILSRFIRGKAFDIIATEISNGNMQPHIIYNTDKVVRGPRVCCIKREIEIYERYLEFMWAFTYSHWVVMEEYVIKTLQNKHFGGKNSIDMAIINRAQLLGMWTQGIVGPLHVAYGDWDLRLPNPQSYTSEKEKYYGEKVDGLFLDAIYIILWHEASHIIKKHCDGGVEGTNEYVRKCELEADKNAFDVFMDGETDSEKRFLKGISVLIAYISLFFLVEHPCAIKQDSHIDLDTRLVGMLKATGVIKPEYEDYLYRFGCVIFERYFEINSELFSTLGIYQPSVRVATAKDLFLEYINRIEILKTKCNH